MSEKKEETTKKEKKHKTWYKLSSKKNFQLLALAMMYISIELMLYVITLYMARGVGESSIFYVVRDFLLVASTIGYVMLSLYIMAIVAYLFNRILESNDTIIKLEKELELLKKK